MPWRRYARTDARRYLTQAQILLGRRGTALLLVGTIWLLQAATVAVTPPNLDYWLLSRWSTWRAFGWAITGLTAIYYAWRRRDFIGWAALYIMPAYRVIAYGLAFADWLDDAHGGPGNPRGIVGFLAWGTSCLFLNLLGAWPETQEISDQRAEGSSHA